MDRDLVNNTSLLIYNILTTQYSLSVSLDEVMNKVDKYFNTCKLLTEDFDKLNNLLKSNECINKITQITNDMLKSVCKDKKLDMNDIPSILIFVNEFINIMNNYSRNQLNIKVDVKILIELIRCLLINILGYILKTDKNAILNLINTVFTLVQSSIELDTNNRIRNKSCCFGLFTTV